MTSEKVTAPHILANIGDILGVLDSTAPGGGHYTGPIILVGFYNPDALILPGSDALQEGLNAAIEAELSAALPERDVREPVPGVQPGQASRRREQESICKYTEMCNPNVDPGGSSDDGDIHPSPLGYKVLGRAGQRGVSGQPGAADPTDLAHPR